MGLATREPDTQKYPAAQLPVGAVSPDVWQYLPPSHSVHWFSALNPVLRLYVPAGQDTGSKPVPVGQYDPMVHGSATLRRVHMKPAGHVMHAPARVSFMNVPAGHDSAAEDPAGQNCPVLHGPPRDVAVVGVGVELPDTQ